MVANGPDQRDAGPSQETDQSLAAASLAPILESLLGVHSAPETAWLADAASTAAERGIGALYSLLYLVDASSGHLQGERPASSERIRGLAKLNQEFGANLTALKFDPGDMDAVRSVLQTGRASVVQAVGEALPLPMDRKLLGDVQHRLGVAEVVGDGGVEQVGILHDRPDGVAQRLQGHGAHVLSVDADRSLGDVVQTRDERRQRRLARAGRTHQGDGRAR